MRGTREFKPELTPGVSLEYTANPLWGLGVNYTYLPYGDDYGVKGSIDAFAHEASVFASVNLSNLLATYRSGNWQKFNIYSNWGGGYSFYEFDNQVSGLKGDNSCLFRYSDLTAEYNISNLLAIGLGAQYRIHHTNNMRGKLTSTADNQDFYMAHLSLRCKFGGSSKDKKHVRNVSYEDYARRSVSETPSFLPLLSNLSNKVKELEGRVDDLNGRLNGHIESTNKAISDLERKTMIQAQKEIVDRVFEAIRFDLGSYEIREMDIPSLNELAAFMKENPTWNLRLSGHTDSVGSEELNQTLSERRASAAKNYLMGKGIAANRIIIDGFGDRKPIAPNTTPEGRQLNRRVEMDVRK